MHKWYENIGMFSMFVENFAQKNVHSEEAMS